MKMRIYSQWQSDIFIPMRVRQFTKAAKLCGQWSFRGYSGVMTATSEREAIVEWIDSITPLKKGRSIA